MVDTRQRARALAATGRLVQTLPAGRAYTLPAADRVALVRQMELAVGPETPWRLARALAATATGALQQADATPDRPLAHALRGYAAECNRLALHLQAEGDTWPR